MMNRVHIASGISATITVLAISACISQGAPKTGIGQGQAIVINYTRDDSRYFDPSKPRAKDFTPAVSDAIARGPITTGALDATWLVGSNTASNSSVWPAGKVSVNTTKK
jgi:hypothetical protein